MLCKYCRVKVLDPPLESGHCALKCSICKEWVHLKCLKSGGTPGRLCADIFFIYTCASCNYADCELFHRMKMSWTEIVMLVLYNLTKRHYQASMGGFFHRDKQIKKFMKNHWKDIFPHLKTKRKTWVQMLNTTLKSNPNYFKQGDPPVWFKLTNPNALPISPLLDRKDKTKKTKRQEFVEIVNEDSSTCTNYSSSSRDGENVLTMAENSGINEIKFSFSMQSELQNNMYSRSYVKPSARLSEYLFAGEEDACDSDVNKNTGSENDEDIDIEIIETSNAVNIPTNSSSNFNILFDTIKTDNVVVKEEPISEEDEDMENDFDSSSQAMKTKPTFSTREYEDYDFLGNGLFSKFPWRVNAPSFQTSQCQPMNLSEEAYELSSLSRRIAEADSMSVAELRLHRKLKLRRLKRERNLPIFNLDDYTMIQNTPYMNSIASSRKNIRKRVLDRFVQQRIVMADECSASSSSYRHSANKNSSFWTRVMGHTNQQYTCFISPFTQRTLKPFIRRDFETRPLWLKLLNELTNKFNRCNNDGAGIIYEQSSIDYSYVRPQHIPAVNSLAEQYFWPGINLSECLQFPDFSCVVLYKKLVVAFAFMVPDADLNEAYISFIFTRPEWRRAGIASFMLYHLIQTCMGRDITLHVSATNPAVLLYQKFGFKIEEFVQDFYDKYLPVNSNECRHALFLRLKR